MTSQGYRAVFRVREFRFVFAAHVFSLLGGVVSHVALPVLVYTQTASPLMSAVTMGLGFMPQALGGALLAPVAERFPARPVLIGCDLICAASVAAMAVPGMPLAALLVLRALTAFVQPLFGGVRAAGLGDFLKGDAFVLGRSLIRISAQGAQIAGFAATGLLLLALPPRGALLLTVAGFLVSAALLRIGTVNRPPAARPAPVTAPGSAPDRTPGTASGTERGADGRAAGAPKRGSARRTRTGGTRALFADRRIRALLLLNWLPPAFVVVPEGLAAPYSAAIGAGPVGVGLLLAAMPVGGVAAELAVGALLRPKARERLVLPLAGSLLLPFLLFAWRPGLPLALAALLVAGTGVAYTLGLDRWFFDAVPEELRARAMTVMTAGLMSVQGLGMAAGGVAAEFMPPHWAIVAAGGLGTVCVLAAVGAVRAAGAVPAAPDAEGSARAADGSDCAPDDSARAADGSASAAEAGGPVHETPMADM
ncbi:MFS transporter [Streptomyces marispadix]|uniref:MFS transporter n=1 Tax=Streptomyces marispadix TaxID=2922868 RepID=A0ABS9T2F9_9ACTN|nr:MFS transporter [Streptomyces marispadix]MCH6162697.1 MFS transporter [Streptomyces marispadix]